MVQYGFFLPANQHDRLPLLLTDIYSSTAEGDVVSVSGEGSVSVTLLDELSRVTHIMRYE